MCFIIELKTKADNALQKKDNPLRRYQKRIKKSARKALIAIKKKQTHFEPGLGMVF